MHWKAALARLTAAAVVAAPLAVTAHITDIAVDSVKPFTDGASFGDVGAYRGPCRRRHSEEAVRQLSLSFRSAPRGQGRPMHMEQESGRISGPVPCMRAA